MADIAPHAELVEGLYRAIGRVVSESAKLERVLRNTLSELEYTDRLIILFEGQSWEWLAQSVKVVLDQFVCIHWEGERNEMIGLINEMTELRDMRNWVAHSTWRIDCYFEGSDDEECLPSERARLSPESAFHFNRSRFRKWRAERQLTIEDVEEIADRIRDLRERLSDCSRRIDLRRRHLPDVEPAAEAAG
ncbi:hypothetical protein ACLQ22_30845 [Micromonospora sp. DT178]|uniref:hypothetical protein n=1 Tax=Micromonospora sp. DT178 TaxID=3393436 RepID=UPI003CEE9CE8